MKKSFLIMFMFLFLLCGCSLKQEDKYAEYQHYSLTNRKNINYSYIHENGNITDYAVIQLSTDYEGYSTDGLLYKVGINDYILLDEITDGVTDLSSSQNYFYKDTKNDVDKLYIHRSLWPTVTEYALNDKNFTKKDLKFDVKKITNAEISNLLISSIQNVDNDYLYITAASVSGYNGSTPVIDLRGINIKCSLKDYICVEND